jgi:four helix bundle protein
MELQDLEIYKIALELSNTAWQIYTSLKWQDKKIIGDQFITASDSIGANISEGFGRYHYADRNKFNYNARGSLFESVHWLKLMLTREHISQKQYDNITEILNNLSVKLNNYINTTKNLKRKNEQQ